MLREVFFERIDVYSGVSTKIFATLNIKLLNSIAFECRHWDGFLL